MSKKVDYRFYATLLDAFQNYLDSDTIYQKYWGFSENPQYTEDEFRKKQFEGLIDRINRVPCDSEVADRGTAFNEVIDCIVKGKDSGKVKVSRVRNESDTLIGLKCRYNGREFYFPMTVIREFSEYYKGALPQQYIQGLLPTSVGEVVLYGYIDYILPFSTHDLKTTRQYVVGNYKNHWQHLVYPYCLAQNGCNVPDFEYNILEITERKSGNTFATYTESYSFVAERDVPRLISHCEDLIYFLNENRSLINDKKIFNFR